MVMHKLTSRKVASAAPGKHADGNGLWLLVKPTGARSWIFRFTLDGRESSIGLGSAMEVGLIDARNKAEDARRDVRAGRSPIKVRRDKEPSKAPPKTFEEVARELHGVLSKGWRSSVNAPKWMRAIELHCGPLLSLPISTVQTADIRRVLEPIWMDKPETASRLRGQIEAVIDFARANEIIERTAPNPAQWRGHLQHLLPRQKKLIRGHHAAIPYRDLPDFVATLQSRRATSALTIEFMILTAARVGEAAGAQWDEIDFHSEIWTVPENRMKAGKEHRVPLSPRAVEILREMETVRTSRFVFPGLIKGRPITVTALDKFLDNMSKLFTLHGMRSVFRDWAADCTDVPREVAEAALAHKVGSAVELAYKRTDLLERRRKLMEQWASHCSGG
jgi:integrase